MLHYETIAPATRKLLNRLMSDNRLHDFVLVGGTSLALQLGHRLSVDLDLFTDTDFNEDSMRAYLEKNYHFPFIYGLLRVARYNGGTRSLF